MSNGESGKVSVLTTGGTISSVYDAKIGAYRPGFSLEKLLKSLPPGMDKIEVITQELFQLDSANAQPHHWQDIANAIKQVSKDHPDIDGVVILHGTDTMAYSAAAISLMIQDFGKPIVLTGSQIPAIEPWSDGPRNIRDAIRVAAWADLGETSIVFNGEIHRGTRARKIRERAYDAFDSVDPTPLGLLGHRIVLYENRIRRNNLVPKFRTEIDDKVCLLKVFPGMSPKIIDRIVDLDYHGLVIEGYGSGNIPAKENSLAESIRNALDHGCVVVMTTQCAFGQADLSLYEVGKAALEVGALSAYDMTSETTVVKLMWCLGQTNDHDKIKEMMMHNYVGEITMSGAIGMSGA